MSRRSPGALVGLVCALVLAACGGGDSGDSGPDFTLNHLGFYDWEANLIPNPAARSDRATETPFARIYDAVLLASEQPPECFEDSCSAPGATFYAFGAKSKKLLAGPAPSRDELFTGADEGRFPGSQILTVPQGIIVVEDERAPDALAPGYFVLKDRPALTVVQISSAEPVRDPITNQQAIGIEFTPAGQAQFSELTKRIAERSREFAPSGIDPGAASALSGHFAIVVNDRVISRPIVNFVDNPAGIDGSHGITIGGAFTAQGAEEFSRLLEAKAGG